MPYYKDTENQLHWLDSTEHEFHLPEGCVQITDEEAKTLHPIPDETTYAQKRAAEYPSITDQLDLIYHGGVEAWKEVIDTIKTKYPKG